MREIIQDKKTVIHKQGGKMFASTNIRIDFQRPYCGYGWTDQVVSTNGFPMQYIDPQGKGWIYMAVRPDTSYLIRSVFQAEDNVVARQIGLKVTQQVLQKVAYGKDGMGFYVEWVAPVEVIDVYNGWLMLEFDLEGPCESTAGKPALCNFQYDNCEGFKLFV